MRVGLQRLQLTGACALMLVWASGCRQDMQNQPKMIPQRHTDFFSDGRSARQQVLGTVGRSQLVSARYLTTGLIGGAEGNTLPFPVTRTVLARGQEQYNVYCSPCHSRVGNGKGAIVQRGYYSAGNFQSARLRQAPLGHFFWVMTHGYGAMPNYSAEIRAEDRWAIVAYIRALQLSQNAENADIPTGVHVDHMRDLLVRASLPANFLDTWDVSMDSDVPVSRIPAAPGPSSPEAAPPDVPVSGTLAKPSTAASSEKKEIATAAGTTGKESGQDEKKPAPPPASTGDVAHGKVLYNNNCSVCHQPTRAGIPPVFPSLLGIVEKDGEAKVRKSAKDGIPDAKPPMPPHPDFTESDLDDLIAFLKTK